MGDLVRLIRDLNKNADWRLLYGKQSDRLKDQELVLRFLAFFFVKGMSPSASVEEGTFLRLFMPGFPPFVLLTASIPLLYPEYGPRLAAR